MNIWNPPTSLNPMLNIINDFLDKVENTNSDFSPRVHYKDHEVAVDLPGYSKEEVVIHITSDTTLLVRAENKSRGILNTKIYISDNIDISNLEASFTNGVLSLKYPKPQEFKPRLLEIK